MEQTGTTPTQAENVAQGASIQARSYLNVGRPRAFTSVQDLQERVGKYLTECSEAEVIPTIAELAAELGVSRETIYDYNKKDEFSDTIKHVRNFILGKYERKLANTNSNAGGIIFLAKNYGYADRQEIEFTKPLEIIMKDYRGKEIEQAEPAEFTELPGTPSETDQQQNTP